MFLVLTGGRLTAAPTGPTLHFDFGSGRAPDNPLSKFMYFVPLISPDPVSVFTNAGNTQCARVVSFHCKTNGTTFHTICEFEFVGAGLERNVFDCTKTIANHEKDLKAGRPLTHVLASINVEGAGSGSVEIDGAWTNGAPAVTELRLHFNRKGQTSPVSISLEDIGWKDNAMCIQNEMVARVNVLAFRREPGTPKMEVTLDSLKAKGASDGLWQNFFGGLKGAAVNLFLPPLPVTVEGHQTMLDFGLALAMAKTEFTFPFATRLESGPSPAP
jgi:hypothetical protein